MLSCKLIKIKLQKIIHHPKILIKLIKLLNNIKKNKRMNHISMILF